MAIQLGTDANNTYKIDVPAAAGVGNLAAFSLVGWFYLTDTAASGNFLNILTEDLDTDGLLSLQAKTAGGINAFYRQSSAGSSISITSSAVDDSTWRWYHFVKRASNDYQFYIDGTSQGTSATTITQPTTINNAKYCSETSGSNLPSGSRLANLSAFPFALTAEQAKAVAFGYGLAARGVGASHYYMLLDNIASQPDMSIGAYTATSQNGFTKVDHPSQSRWRNAGGRITIPPYAELSGTITTATEADIRAGGKTIVLTLSGTTWIP